MLALLFSLIAIFSVVMLVWRYFVIAGPLKPNLYPPSSNSQYFLPWEAGVSRLCWQGNKGILSHKGRWTYAYDFLMVEGTPIHAARGGKVVIAVDTNMGSASDRPNNEIFIDHGDGTKSRYIHIQKGGCKVKVGDTVTRGQLIALSGEVGRSLRPHMHFEVIDQTQDSIPITFADVTEHSGVPRTLFFYTAKTN